MLRRLNKHEYTTVTSYYVIRLLNYLGNVCEKVLADMISKRCKIGQVLHEGQMGSRRQGSAINAMARVISRVQKT